jgi:integrase
MGALAGWADLEAAVPQVAATMRRYLIQISCVLRPGSVGGADLALRSFAAFLAQAAPEVTSTAQITRRHIEDYKPWLAARPGQNKPRLTPGTIIHRLGTLRMFFIRLDEWGWAEAPARRLIFARDVPRLPRALPRYLPAGADRALLAALEASPDRLLAGALLLLRATGMRIGELTLLELDCVHEVPGAGAWLTTSPSTGIGCAVSRIGATCRPSRPATSMHAP